MVQRIFSGIQPTGIIHIGNYFGAIRNWLTMKDDYELFACIVDLHALTVFQDPVARQQNILNLLKLYLAAGLDPKKATIFIQSHVPEHTMLSWLLSTVTPMAELERMTQYKDKAAQHKENINTGLFTYPVLMAADILLYNTHVVPVGEDQVQHVELARVIARKFNQKFGETFVEPKHFIPQMGARVMGLDDPSKKMSKSAPSPNNYIALTDDPDTVTKKIMRAVTDSGSEIIYDAATKPAIANLLAIYSLVTDKPIADIQKSYQGKGYGDFKKGLANAINEFLAPLQARMAKLTDAKVLAIAKKGAKRASLIARKKMKEVMDKVGLIQP